MEHGRYWIVLFNEGGEIAGVERELARHWAARRKRGQYTNKVQPLIPTDL